MKRLAVVFWYESETEANKKRQKRSVSSTFSSLNTHHVCFSLGGVLANGEVQSLYFHFHPASHLDGKRFLSLDCCLKDAFETL